MGRYLEVIYVPDPAPHSVFVITAYELGLKAPEGAEPFKGPSTLPKYLWLVALMTLIIIFGPPAVGKMTVGLELERLTGLRLLHNHMTVDPIVRLFPLGSPAYSRLVGEFRQRIFEEFAATDESGLIFTFVWALDDDGDRRFVERTMKIFADRGADVWFVELQASQAERLWRNGTPLRMSAKLLQRDIEGSNAFLLEADTRYQLNTRDRFFYPDRHLKIENTALAPEVVARQVADHFCLPVLQRPNIDVRASRG